MFWSKKMKSWSEVYSYWQEAVVPDIEEVPFDYSKYPYALPLFNIEQDSQIAHHNKPKRTTAYHLLSYLRGKDPELKVAYKVLAYGWHYDYVSLLYPMLKEVFERHDETTHGWWSRNSKYLLPSTACDEWSAFPPKKLTTEKAVVDGAIKKWTELHKEWRLIKLPEYLDRDDPERIKFEEAISKVELDREYQQYLRLKNQFEGDDQAS